MFVFTCGNVGFVVHTKAETHDELRSRIYVVHETSVVFHENVDQLAVSITVQPAVFNTEFQEGQDVAPALVNFLVSVIVNVIVFVRQPGFVHDTLQSEVVVTGAMKYHQPTKFNLLFTYGYAADHVCLTEVYELQSLHVVT